MVQTLKAALLGLFVVHSTTIWLLVISFLPLSFLTFGGVNAILPQLHEQVVQHFHWVSEREFYELLALAFAAPGPNMLFVAMLGSRVAGFPGAMLATLAVVLPTSVLLIVIARWWFRGTASPLRNMLQNGILPITTGVFFMAAITMNRAVVHSGLGLALSVGTLIVVLRTQVHPLWLLALGGMVGACFQV